MIHKIILLLFVVFFIQDFKAQNSLEQEVDSLYREDQFYIGVTYNLLNETPSEFSQTGFSSGFQLGYIRDMPINKKRTLAIGLGFGYSINSFNQNLFINKDNTGALSYSILDKNTYLKNKFSSHLIECPLEFRWRSSTATDYNFWRIYGGFKVSYRLANRINYIGDLGTIKLNNIDSFNEIQYGFTLSVGYNTWNMYLYYGLNTVFSSEAQLNGTDLNIRTVKIGLIFYLL